MLADTLSRLIEIDDDIKLPAEQEGHEFRYVPFEQLPPAQVTVMEEVIINEVSDVAVKIQHINPVQKDLKIELPISNLKLKELQEQDQPSQKTVVRKQAQQEHLHHGEQHPEKEGNRKYTCLQASDNS